MSKRFLFCVPLICSWMIGAGLGFGAHTAAAADCLAEPNRDAPEGLHWYYRVDRENDRKCAASVIAISPPREVPTTTAGAAANAERTVMTSAASTAIA